MSSPIAQTSPHEPVISEQETATGRAPFENISLPSMSSEQYTNELPDFEEERFSPQVLTPEEKYKKILKEKYYGDKDFETKKDEENKTVYNIIRRLLGKNLQLRPRSYTSSYLKPNVCPEELWRQAFRWPRFRYINAKVPPPANGSYNDYLHYLQYKNWFDKEREVYIAHMILTGEMYERCALKEGKYNAAKNCQHLGNKYFALTRMEEYNQALLYMSLTGNAAIRETPYPKDFVDQKRKIYNDWLFRTRMRKPNDPY